MWLYPTHPQHLQPHSRGLRPTPAPATRRDRPRERGVANRVPRALACITFYHVTLGDARPRHSKGCAIPGSYAADTLPTNIFQVLKERGRDISTHERAPRQLVTIQGLDGAHHAPALPRMCTSELFHDGAARGRKARRGKLPAPPASYRPHRRFPQISSFCRRSRLPGSQDLSSSDRRGCPNRRQSSLGMAGD